MARLIDADALIERVTGNGLKPITEQIFHKLIDDAPTIDAVSVVHGKWIDRSDGIEGAWNYCSVCGEQAIDLYDFCPNCGAKMDGERKTDD